MSLYKWIVIFIFQIDNKILKLESFLAILDKNNLSQKHSHTKYQFEREINTSNHYLLEDCLINEIYIRPDEIDKIIYVSIIIVSKNLFQYNLINLLNFKTKQGILDFITKINIEPKWTTISEENNLGIYMCYDVSIIF